MVSLDEQTFFILKKVNLSIIFSKVIDMSIQFSTFLS